MSIAVKDSQIECEEQDHQSDEPDVGPNLEIGGVCSEVGFGEKIEYH